ncbi:MAG TPA: hypothetical protein VF507_00700 [Pyrinomonadaceae bacterium]|jgi:hypothetical protein
MTQTADSAITEELRALDETFVNIHVEDNSGPVPDGRWQGRIESAPLTRATSQRPMIEWHITVTTEGPQAGKKVVVRWVITDKTLEWIKKALHVLRLDMERISAIADHLPKVEGALIDFTIKTKDEHRNVYFNRRLDGGGAHVEERAATVIEDFPA